MWEFPWTPIGSYRFGWLLCTTFSIQDTDPKVISSPLKPPSFLIPPALNSDCLSDVLLESSSQDLYLAILLLSALGGRAWTKSNTSPAEKFLWCPKLCEVCLKKIRAPLIFVIGKIECDLLLRGWIKSLWIISCVEDMNTDEGTEKTLFFFLWKPSERSNTCNILVAYRGWHTREMIVCWWGNRQTVTFHKLVTDCVFSGSLNTCITWWD